MHSLSSGRTARIYRAQPLLQNTRRERRLARLERLERVTLERHDKAKYVKGSAISTGVWGSSVLFHADNVFSEARTAVLRVVGSRGASNGSPELAVLLNFSPQLDFEFCVLQERIITLRRFLARCAGSPPVAPIPRPLRRFPAAAFLS